MDSIILIGQKNTLAEYMILFGADNRPPMLDKDLVQSQRGKRDATWFRDKVLLVEAQGNGKVLNEKELEFLADPAKAVLMANLSSYGSDVLSEVPISDNTNIAMLIQSVQEMPYSKPSHFMEHTENEIHSDSNIIPYSQYLIESQNAVV
ncbi:hypothetical protein Tco_0990940 [Tanacetum coccineum]|uniref:Uncharacterized protein n=1 Tax=Tanacetum coccineum TaxID=301880 RepID=A0ABQ5EXX7_9ASTR